MSSAATKGLEVWHEIGAQNTSEFGWQFLENYNSSLSGETNKIFLTKDEDLPDTLMRTWGMSEIFVARSDTVDLVSAAADSLPYHPVLAKDEIPGDFGFLWLMKPLSILDRHGKVIRVHCVQWWPSDLAIMRGDEKHNARVITYALYSNASDPLDSYSADPVAQFGMQRGLRWPLSHLGFVAASQDVFGTGEETTVQPTDLHMVESEEGWQGAVFQRWLTAWWLLLRQEMVEVEPGFADRATRRRFQHATAKGHPIPQIKVVDLRRRERAARDDATEAGQSVDWTHRWGVRPHWRRQWYPSLQEHKLILIDFQVRGPADKPLVLKPTVFDVRPPRSS
jgi:hypothetical protein